MDEPPPETKTMRQKLFESHFLHHSCPPEKEFVESFAFFSKSSDLLAGKDLIIDVCGGHGMIGLLYVIYGKAKNAIILDRNKPKTFKTFCDESWKESLIGKGTVTFLEGDLYDLLPTLLKSEEHNSIGVVACHACAFLTDDIMNMCFQNSIEFAVMTCCQSDDLNGSFFRNSIEFAVMSCCQSDDLNGTLKAASISTGVPLALAKDFVSLGKIVQAGMKSKWKTIDSKITPQNRILFGMKPKWKTIDSKITPQNRILFGLIKTNQDNEKNKNVKIEKRKKMDSHCDGLHKKKIKENESGEESDDKKIEIEKK